MTSNVLKERVDKDIEIFLEKNPTLSKEDLNKLIYEKTKRKLLGLYGSERVNVLELNMAVNDMRK